MVLRESKDEYWDYDDTRFGEELEGWHGIERCVHAANDSHKKNHE